MLCYDNDCRIYVSLFGKKYVIVSYTVTVLCMYDYGLRYRSQPGCYPDMFGIQVP